MSLADGTNWRKFKFSDLKEVKKLKKEIDFSKIPYFEVKVVKVKKHKVKTKVKIFILERVETKNIKGEIIKVKYNDPKLYLYRHGESKVGDEAVYPDRKIWKIIKIIDPKESKGNFVNGENLDKIKFPCFCSYKVKTFVNIGQLNKGRMGYELCYMGEQDKENNIIDGCGKLENLIKAYDIHILKGKILIFQEGNE